MFDNGSISTISFAADSSGTTKYAQYTYLGLGRIIKTEHPNTTNNLTLAYSLGAAGQYSGLDRFGRIVQKLWKKGILDGTNYDGFLSTVADVSLGPFFMFSIECIFALVAALWGVLELFLGFALRRLIRRAKIRYRSAWIAALFGLQFGVLTYGLRTTAILFCGNYPNLGTTLTNAAWSMLFVFPIFSSWVLGALEGGENRTGGK